MQPPTPRALTFFALLYIHKLHHIWRVFLVSHGRYTSRNAREAIMKMMIDLIALCSSSTRVIIRSGRKRSELQMRELLAAAAAQRCSDAAMENFNSALSQLHNKTQTYVRYTHSLSPQALSIIATIIVRKKHLRQIMFCSAAARCMCRASGSNTLFYHPSFCHLVFNKAPHQIGDIDIKKLIDLDCELNLRKISVSLRPRFNILYEILINVI